MEHDGKWIVQYPYLIPKESLRGNKSMLTTEKKPIEEQPRGDVYYAQIKDMFDRGAAGIVPEDELANYA